ncbi:MAG TPA: Fe-S cluster assembly protein SufD [Fulvivirga sp.]|nr:Fe-S cluster assembly protein SufD [Fulvivirga sp.]
MTEVAERNITLEGLHDRFGQLDAMVPIHKIRSEAFNHLNNIGLPKVKNEEYKYTNVTKALEKNFNFAPAASPSKIEQTTIDEITFDGLDAYRLVFINGHFSPDLSDNINVKGVSVMNVAKAIENIDKDFLKHFGTVSSKNDDAFFALNTSLTEDGAYINIADNVVLDKPLALCFIIDSSDKSTYTTSRNLIVTGVNSQVDILEIFATQGSEGSFSNTATEIVVGENAHVNFYKIQNNKENAYQVDTTQVSQSRSSVFSTYTFTLNGAIIRNNLNVAIAGEGCESHMYGLYVVDDKTHIDNHTVADHISPNSFSNELYKGILEDNAKAVFNGKVFVRKEAQKTNAFQSNKNILLSDTAVINTKPQLEIWADDVKCTHGCTTGQLDDEALFYLRSRGLDKDHARSFLLYAFAIEVIEQVKLDPLKEYLKHIISERLHKDF